MAYKSKAQMARHMAQDPEAAKKYMEQMTQEEMDNLPDHVADIKNDPKKQQIKWGEDWGKTE